MSVTAGVRGFDLVAFTLIAPETLMGLHEKQYALMAWPWLDIFLSKNIIELNVDVILIFEYSTSNISLSCIDGAILSKTETYKLKRSASLLECYE